MSTYNHERTGKAYSKRWSWGYDDITDPHEFACPALAVAMRDTRVEMNLSQGVMAKRMEVSRPYLALIERAKKPVTIDMKDRILKAYDGAENWGIVPDGGWYARYLKLEPTPLEEAIQAEGE